MLAASEPVAGSVMAKAAIDWPLSDLAEIVGALAGGAEQADRARAEPLHGEGEIGEARMVGEGRAGDGEAAHVERAVGDGQAEITGVAELGDERADFGFDVVAVGGGEVGRPRPESRPSAVAAVEEWRWQA